MISFLPRAPAPKYPDKAPYVPRIEYWRLEPRRVILDITQLDLLHIRPSS